MLVLKNSGIDLTNSETRTIIGFSLIYSILVLLILSAISFLYYQFKKDLMLQEKRQTLQNYSNNQIANLKELHINIDKSDIYPKDERFSSAIFDSSKKLIFSNLKMKDVNLDEVIYIKDGYIHLIKEPEAYYLGSKYVIVEIEDDNLWFINIKYEIIFWFFISFFILLTIGYYIAKLFLRPMREAILMLDRFIKDTTHELNTPIAAILSNIQMIEKESIDEKLAKKINRIEIGAKTISNIYEDLTFVSLNNQIISNNEKIYFSKILNQRVDFFKSIANSKKVEFILDIKDDVFIDCDIKKLSKLIDNIISNAIKYNKFKGFIKVTLKDGLMIVEDSGKGISKEDLKSLFTRYKRFDKSVGGFGIGLNIVSLIAKEYGFKIDVISKIDVGTRIKIRW